jgi:hypothetical protein
VGSNCSTQAILGVSKLKAVNQGRKSGVEHSLMGLFVYLLILINATLGVVFWVPTGTSIFVVFAIVSSIWLMGLSTIHRVLTPSASTSNSRNGNKDDLVQTLDLNRRSVVTSNYDMSEL